MDKSAYMQLRRGDEEDETVPLPTAALRLRRSPHWSLWTRWSSIGAVAGLTVLLFIAAFGPLLAPHASRLSLPERFLSPSFAHPLGSDQLGQDVLQRVVVGARYSLVSMVCVLSVALVIGTVIGAAAGYVGGLLDEFLMRVTDIFLAFPPLVLALAISATLGGGYPSAILAIAAVWWPTYARLVRGQVLATKENDYVDAARALGVKGWRIVRVHILRNSMTPVIVQLTLDMGNVLVTFAGLSFLGLGAPAGSPEWGATISAGQQYLLTSWWIAVFPGLALYLAALSMNLFGDLFGAMIMPSRVSKLSVNTDGRTRSFLGRSAGTGFWRSPANGQQGAVSTKDDTVGSQHGRGV